MNVDKKMLNEYSQTFDEFVNLAIDKITSDEIDIVKVMIAYNYIKNALSTIDFEDEE